MYEKIKKGFAFLQHLTLVATGIALVLIMAVVLLQTFTRFVIFHSLPWSEELSRYLFVFIIMIGLNVAIRDDMLIRIDAIDYLLKNRNGKLILTILRLCVGLVVSVIVMWSSTSLFRIGMIQKSPAMRIPMITMYGVVFSGYFLAVIAQLFKLIDILRAPYDAEDGEDVA
jgi:TRAP-type C4-dicarboxylate transport system permease small subunit